MGRVIHFEITADDVDRASAFYGTVFGWSTTASPYAEGYHLAATGDGSGIDGAIMTRDYKEQPTIVWVEVDDIDAAIDRTRHAGGSVAGEKLRRAAVLS